MDLRNGRITIGEILTVPQAKAVLQKEIPQFLNSPMVGMAKGMSLNQVASMAKGHLPPAQLKSIITQLENL